MHKDFRWDFDKRAGLREAFETGGVWPISHDVFPADQVAGAHDGHSYRSAVLRFRDNGVLSLHIGRLCPLMYCCGEYFLTDRTLLMII